jgi:starch synthase
MKKTKVLFVSQEITPYLPENQLSKTARELPQAIQEKNREIRTFMPRFGNVNERRNQLHEVIRLSGMNLIIDDNDQPLIIKVASIQAARMQVYFIDNEEYFQRKCTIRDADGKFFDDNDERMLFFCKGVLETVKKLGWSPDIIHCQGWMSALLPLLVKTTYKDEPLFSESKVVYSLYEDMFDEKLNHRLIEKLILEGVDKEMIEDLKPCDYSSLTKHALRLSDGVVVHSDSISNEFISFAEQNNKPILPFTNPDSFNDECSNFYDLVLQGESVGEMAI